MVRKIFLLFISLFLVSGSFQKAWGQVSFYDARLSDYGQLEQVLGDKWNTVDSLIVHGPINEAEMCIRDRSSGVLRGDSET